MQISCRAASTAQHLGGDLQQEASRHSLQQQGWGIGVQSWRQGGLEVGALNVHHACAASAYKGECQVRVMGLLPVCLDCHQVRGSLRGVSPCCIEQILTGVGVCIFSAHRHFLKAAGKQNRHSDSRTKKWSACRAPGEGHSIAC